MQKERMEEGGRKNEWKSDAERKNGRGRQKERMEEGGRKIEWKRETERKIGRGRQKERMEERGRKKGSSTLAMDLMDNFIKF